MTGEWGLYTATPDSVLALREYARNAAVDVSITVGGATIVGAGIALAGAVIRRTIRGLAALPPAARIAIASAGVLAIVHPGSRRALMTSMGHVGLMLVDAVGSALPILAELSQQAATARARAQEALRRAEVQLGRPGRQLARTYVLAALGGAHAPLGVFEIVRNMHTLGYRSTSRAPHEYVQRLLRADRQFVQDSCGRWMTRASSATA